MATKVQIILSVAVFFPSVVLCGQTCLSCSGVDNSSSCKDQSVCNNNEVCFMHKYRTESKTELFDYGCSYPELCIHFYPNTRTGLERRASEGHHVMCRGCCNDTSLCNAGLPCDDPTMNHGLPRECSDLSETTSGVYTIYPDGFKPVNVYCEIANGEKWTVVQRRLDGSEDFYRTWNDYKNGFGSAGGEYWLGNENIHLISTGRGHKLSIFLEDFDNMTKYANYSRFMLGDEHHKYPVTVSGFIGSSGCGDSLEYHNNQAFATKDNDVMKHGCPQLRHGAWWYVHCSYSNLNGPYTVGQGTDGSTMSWYHWRKYYSLKQTKMMIMKV